MSKLFALDRRDGHIQYLSHIPEKERSDHQRRMLLAMQILEEVNQAQGKYPYTMLPSIGTIAEAARQGPSLHAKLAHATALAEGYSHGPLTMTSVLWSTLMPLVDLEDVNVLARMEVPLKVYRPERPGSLEAILRSVALCVIVSKMFALSLFGGVITALGYSIEALDSAEPGRRLALDAELQILRVGSAAYFFGLDHKLPVICTVCLHLITHLITLVELLIECPHTGHEWMKS